MSAAIDYGWREAVDRANETGDVERARSLGILAGELLDLLDKMPFRDWLAMYRKVSERAGVAPTLRLVK